MHLALLFDSGHAGYEPNYDRAALRRVFQTGLVQKSDRHIKLGSGDVLIPNGTRAERNAMRERIYFEHGWGLRHAERLRATYGRAEVSAMVFENMPKQLGENLHAALSTDDGYLGVIEVDLTYGPHLALFRNYIGSRYRLKGSMARVFYSMSSDDGKDPNEVDELLALGYADVEWEDDGAHGTIFDNFDTLEHFAQVAAFRDAVRPFLPGGEDDAFELAMVLEDLNPQLFNALGAAASAIGNAAHEEHVAQAALSGRRYMERLADALFPPRAELYNGRAVGADKYRNRLWAFIGDNLKTDNPSFSQLGAEVDRLVEELNGGLHGDRPKERILQALADAARLTAALLALNPKTAREPYAPFLPAIERFLKRALKRSASDEDVTHANTEED